MSAFRQFDNFPGFFLRFSQELFRLPFRIAVRPSRLFFSQGEYLLDSDAKSGVRSRILSELLRIFGEFQDLSLKISDSATLTLR